MITRSAPLLTLILSSLAVAQATHPAEPPKPRLGVMLTPTPHQSGALVSDVMVGYAAEAAGLRPGDRIVRIDEVEIEDLEAFRDAVGKLQTDQRAKFVVVRDDEEVTIDLVMSSPRADAPGANPPTNPALRDELLKMMEKDQAPRRKIMQENPSQQEMEAITQELTVIDAANRDRLKQIIAQHGYPTITMVERDGAEAAFLIVQHADADQAWQAEMLPVLTEFCKRGEVSKSSVAYLTDRVLRAQNKPQLYGTQYHQEPGPDGQPQFMPPIVEDPAKLDKRRISMGLGPWAEYEAQMARMQNRDPFPAPRGP